MRWSYLRGAGRCLRVRWLDRNILLWRLKEREGLKKGGLVWVQHRVGTANKDEVKRYLELLMKVPDEETRRVAKGLLAKVQ
jgi:hypothetical protein